MYVYGVLVANILVIKLIIESLLFKIIFPNKFDENHRNLIDFVLFFLLAILLFPLSLMKNS